MKIIFPPRPEGKIHPSQLSKLEARGKYVVQRKFRGSRNLIHRSTKGDISFFSRYGRGHKKFKLPGFLQSEIASLAFEKGKEYWLDSELMDPRIKNTVILFDVLQAGPYLYGVDQESRLQILDNLCHNPEQPKDPQFAICVTKHVWLAQHWDSHFEMHFSEMIDDDNIEGLVLRERKSCLDHFGHKMYDVSWQIRCRKPGPNYEM